MIIVFELSVKKSPDVDTKGLPKVKALISSYFIMRL